MKNFISTILFAIFAMSFAQANNTNPAPTSSTCCVCKTKVKLTSATFINFETNETKFGDRATIGQNIQCRVVGNVYADNEVAIRSGARALGRIKGIEQSSTNGEMLILIEMFYVQAVDGQQVPLNGNEQTIQASFTNETTNVNPMLTITAHVMDNIIILID